MFYIKVKLNEREFVLLIVRVIPSAKLLITMIQSPLPRSLLRNTRNDNYTDKHLTSTNITETQKLNLQGITFLYVISIGNA